MVIDHRNLSRIQNKKLVLQQLFNNSETSRAEIARQLNLNKSTVSSIYTELDEEGFIKGVRRGESTSNGGRKPRLICLNPDYGYVACFNLDTTSYIETIFTAVNGEVIHYQREKVNRSGIQEIIEMMANAIKEMQAHDQTINGLLAICLSIHGIVYQNKVVDSPFINLEGVDLEQEFAKRFAVPVVLENEANLSAVFEKDYGGHNNVQDLIVISIHRGIGVGVIANGYLYRGNRGMAGEIGRTLVPNYFDQESSQLVKVESLCSEDAIVNQVKNVKSLTEMTPKQLASLYYTDDQVQQIVNRAIELLAEVSYNSMVGFGPQEVYFNSGLFESIPELFNLINDRLVELGARIPIKMIKDSHLASLLGGSSLAIHRALEMDGYQLTLKLPEEVKNIK